ncbi:MAG: hypothetical protein CM15mP21_3000 [Hyphomicrobiales bacterium]|nr:MAG: hypothetical protein CM15mP21_3000 [Hyphomicrobiales bacterium]
MAWLDRTARELFLAEFISAFGLAMRYFFKQKLRSIIRMKRPAFPVAFVANMLCAATRTGRSVV